MAGTRAGGLKAAAKNLAKDPDFYRTNGAKGGSLGAKDGVIKGFARATPKQRSDWGRQGGEISRRMKK